MIRILLSFIIVACCHRVSAADCPIVPLPSEALREQGRLPVGALKYISVASGELAPVARYLQGEVLKHTGLALPLAGASTSGAGITLALAESGEDNPEGYTLNVRPGGVVIRARTTHGAFNGVVSLLQLIRLAAADENDPSMDCWRITDAPAMTWRGVMLDESRHFFGMENVKMILDWMAFYKLNRFHWHLTDAPGWRIEIKGFPKLTLVGGIGNHTDPLAPAAYYTQEEITEIVRYAGDRFIEVIPEIDMPGHAAAANRAYPEYSGGGSEKHPEFTFNPGKEGTYAYLTRILREIDVLFPSKMIHIGGDEVHFGNEQWKTDADVRRLMKAHDLEDLKAVERYFIERMADSVIQLGARVAGWDEISSTKIAPENTVIFWWRHNKPETLKESIANGYRVVLCPRVPLYFDFVQDSAHISGRKWQGTFSDLETIYHYRPPGIIRNKELDQVAGIQANVWSERIRSGSRLQYMLFPRITALAEAAWTDPAGRDYSAFMGRLNRHERLFEKDGLHYYNADAPASSPEVTDPGID